MITDRIGLHSVSITMTYHLFIFHNHVDYGLEKVESWSPRRDDKDF